MFENIDDRKSILHVDGHEEPRHHREMERHVTFVAGAEVRHRILGPLVGFGEQHAIFVLLVDMPAELFQKSVSLGKILAVGFLALV